MLFIFLLSYRRKSENYIPKKRANIASTLVRDDIPIIRGNDTVYITGYKFDALTKEEYLKNLKGFVELLISKKNVVIYWLMHSVSTNNDVKQLINGLEKIVITVLSLGKLILVTVILLNFIKPQKSTTLC